MFFFRVFLREGLKEKPKEKDNILAKIAFIS
jgi:hypothetical protein